MIWRGECLPAVLVLARPCERSANDDVSRLSQAAPLVRSNTASTEQSWANRRVETLSLAACAVYRHGVLVNARMTRRRCQMHCASSSSCQMAAAATTIDRLRVYAAVRRGFRRRVRAEGTVGVASKQNPCVAVPTALCGPPWPAPLAGGSVPRASTRRFVRLRTRDPQSWPGRPISSARQERRR